MVKPLGVGLGGREDGLEKEGRNGSNGERGELICKTKVTHK